MTLVLMQAAYPDLVLRNLPFAPLIDKCLAKSLLYKSVCSRDGGLPPFSVPVLGLHLLTSVVAETEVIVFFWCR